MERVLGTGSALPSSPRISEPKYPVISKPMTAAALRTPLNVTLYVPDSFAVRAVPLVTPSPGPGPAPAMYLSASSLSTKNKLNPSEPFALTP